MNGVWDVLYRNCPTPINPVRSLSNTWNPRQYSSGSPGSRNPPGRLRTFWKESKSTITQDKPVSIHSLARNAFAGYVVWTKEGLHTITTDRSLQITDFSERRVLATRAQEVAERVKSDTAVAALVEEGEGFFVVCGGLVGVRHVYHFFRVVVVN